MKGAELLPQDLASAGQGARHHCAPDVSLADWYPERHFHQLKIQTEMAVHRSGGLHLAKHPPAHDDHHVTCAVDTVQVERARHPTGQLAFKELIRTI